VVGILAQGFVQYCLRIVCSSQVKQTDTTVIQTVGHHLGRLRFDAFELCAG
jgi:hypothetical protein